MTTEGRPGPVLVNIPKDILSMTIELSQIKSSSYARHRPPKIKTQALSDKVYAALARSRRPCCWPVAVVSSPKAVPMICFGLWMVLEFCCHDLDGQGCDSRGSSLVFRYFGYAWNTSRPTRRWATVICCWLSAAALVIGSLATLRAKPRWQEADHPCRY